MSILIFHIAITLILTGALWFTLIAHYPMFSLVGAKEFPKYEKTHIKRVAPIAWTLLAIELISGILLFLISELSHFRDLLLLNLVGLLLIWAITIVWQYPAHKKLLLGFNNQTHNILINSNFMRTIIWSLRSIILLSILFQSL